MGEVYRARDPRISRDVAIKVLHAHVVNDQDRLRRFEQEVKASGALNHPNVLVIYDVGTQDGAPYIVSELLEGGTLRQRLAPHPPCRGGRATQHSWPRAAGCLGGMERRWELAVYLSQPAANAGESLPGERRHRAEEALERNCAGRHRGDKWNIAPGLA